MSSLGAASTFGATPKFSVIAACYRVERYIDDFFNSLEAQAVADDELEIIAVDDGSDDGTYRVLQSWQLRSRFRVAVLQQRNGGEASARNLGMQHATGEWLTFTDPDDWVDREYFRNVRAFIDSHPDVMQVGTQLVLMHERGDGTFRTGPHPLDAMFDGDRMHNLIAQPGYFAGSAPASFVRSDLVRQFGLEFDVEIKPNFVDAHFVAKYLLSCPEPLLGLVGSAKYFYRKRADGSSTLQTSIAHPSRYTVVPERAYLNLLEYGRQRGDGTAPEWLQNLILYDLSWFFSSDEAVSGTPTAAVGDVAKEFVRHLSRLANELSPVVVSSFTIRPLDSKWRQILLHSFSGADWSTDYVVIDAYDAGRNEVRLACRFVGQAPAMEVVSGGAPVNLDHAKIRAYRYFEHDLLFEWACWVPATDEVTVTKNGERTEIKSSWRGPATFRVTPSEMRSLRPGTSHRVDASPRKGIVGLVAKTRTVAGDARQRTRVANKYRAIAHNLPVNARLKSERLLRRGAAGVVPDRNVGGMSARLSDAEFDNAWVLIDRIHNANDSAETLFRYLRTDRPDVNAWFTIEEGSTDYHRLVGDGFGDRVVPYGSFRWKRLMAKAALVASSHADRPTFDPPELRGLKMPRWRRVFLQHGVIKDDLSAWLNPQHLDLIVVSTEDELQSIVGPYSPYVYSERETKLTGLPRFDRLQAARDEREAQARPKDLLVVAPTWRHWLLKDLAPGSQRRALVDDFAESDFVKLWSRFVDHPELVGACARAGLEMRLLPHPNLERAVGMLQGVSGVETIGYERADLASIFARTALLVTDFSSVAFNIAYLESPTVYFQFDIDRMFSGGHVGRKGYFDYPAMGFGPVAHELEGAVEATVKMIAALEHSGDTPEPWRSRILETFPYRDGRCSERVADEIEVMTTIGRSKG